MRYLVMCAVLVLAGGCALPVPLQIASWAASGFSYAATGKSLSDHAVSAVTHEDCALHRIALGKDICVPIETDGTALAKNSPASKASEPTNRLRDSMIALAESSDNDLQPASKDPGTAKPLDKALLAMAETLNGIDRVAGTETVAQRDAPAHYLVIGRYRALEEAENVRIRHAALGTKIRMVLENGALLYQVTAGPFTRPTAQDMEARLEKFGQHARIAQLCSDGVTPAPCGDSRVQLTQARARDQLTK